MAEQSARINFKEAVCLSAAKVFDSCSAKDCLEDLQVFFTAAGQETIANASAVKGRYADVIDVRLAVEPVLMRQGFFTVDITFYFKVILSSYLSPVSAPTDVTGFAYHNKKTVLYGGDGNVKTFRSGALTDSEYSSADIQFPVAEIKCIRPVCLGARIVEDAQAFTEPLGTVPERVAQYFDDVIIENQQNARMALVTLGLFTIVALERDSQLMIPLYDYLVPDKECALTIPAEEPCEIFQRIKFPIDEFFSENT